MAQSINQESRSSTEEWSFPWNNNSAEFLLEIANKDYANIISHLVRKIDNENI